MKFAREDYQSVPLLDEVISQIRKNAKKASNTLPEIDKFDKVNQPKMVPVKSIYLKLAV